MVDAVLDSAGYASLPAAQLAAVRRRAILSCAVGNFFELFDFTIYGYFAVAITRAFYPSGSMYGTYAAFGAAFLMRPVGAIVLGAYGDRMGRRAALVVTIGLMAAATGLTGLIPTYQSIGIWAPILLVCADCCRDSRQAVSGAGRPRSSWNMRPRASAGSPEAGSNSAPRSARSPVRFPRLSSRRVSARRIFTRGAGAFHSCADSCSARSAITCARRWRKHRRSSARSKPATWSAHHCASPSAIMAAGCCRRSG